MNSLAESQILTLKKQPVERAYKTIFILFAAEKIIKAT